MKLKNLTSLMLSSAVLLLSAQLAQAQITYSSTGINPATNPSAWTSSTTAEIGYSNANGNLGVDGGSTITSGTAYLGYTAGYTGTATIDGSNSSWTNANNLSIGYKGNGTLTASNGGMISVGGSLNVGTSTGTGALDITGSSTVTDTTGTTTVGSNGTISFGGGTLTTYSLWAGSSQITGTGTINTQSIVGDLNLVFDSPGTNQTSCTMNGVTVNLNQSTTGYLGVGYTGSGSLSISQGAGVTSGTGYLGYMAGSTGTANISGQGSTWTNTQVDVGYNGTGILNVSNGGAISDGSLNVGTLNGTGALSITNGSLVTVATNTTVGSHGTITFGGGTLTTGTLFAGSSQLSGTGMINTSGIVGDMNLAFNASTGTNQTFTANGVTVNLNQSSTGLLGVGYIGSGNLSITQGVEVTSGIGYLGYNAGSTGTANISGQGSTWYTTASDVYVGASGNGTLNITNGGKAQFLVPTGNGSGTFIASGNGSTGAVTVNGTGSSLTTGGAQFVVGNNGTGTLQITNGGQAVTTTTWIGSSKALLGQGTGVAIVDGAGSTWTNSSTSFTIGQEKAGSQLSISDGGTVNSGGLSVYAGSMLTTDVGQGSSLNLGTGTFSNAGTLRLVAGAGAANGTYTPVTAGTWSGTGAVQALGGVYNSANNTVTVNAAATGTTGTGASFDLSQTQRALITDPTSGKSVGAGFMAASTSTPVTFNASLLSNATELSALQTILGSGQSVLSDWTFSLNGTTVSSTNPIYLSLFAGQGQSVFKDLEVWDYNGSTWTQFSANDLAYDGTYASFTATTLEDFAVTGQAPAPIPPSILLMGSGLLGLIGIKRRKYLG